MLQSITRIRIAQTHIKEIKESLSNNKKIEAIKTARREGKSYPGSVVTDQYGIESLSHQVGLKHAKDAVEVLNGQQDQSTASAIFGPHIRIHSIKIETEDGYCEVDIDTLRLRLLDGMTEMSIDEMAHMAELASYVNDWQSNK